MPSPKEKRAPGEERAKVKIDIDLSTYGTYDLSKLANVSTGGAFIRTKKLQPVGTEMTMKFLLPGDDHPIEAEGKVMWVYNQPGRSDGNASGMGVQFTRIDAKARDKIKAFVKNSTD